MSPFSFYTVVIPKRLLLVTVILGLLAVTVWRACERRYPTPPPERIAQLMQAVASSAVPAAASPTGPTALLPAYPVAQNLAVGEPAPDFSLVDLSGRVISLSSLRGRPVIVYFWATWCHYCIETMPRLQAARAEHQLAGLEVLAVNILENPDRVRAHARRHGLSLPILLDRDATVTQAYLVRATPSYYFIDRGGILRHIAVGALDPDALADHLDSLLAAGQQETR